ncbi:DUF7144 family membrane protein [Kitasatospora indigofera]|uniref:DUF7144 family membrane protein n=1 Tax=Kitasatospora indigofera TaxID=67307 RepID=UPI0032431D95
MTTNPNPDAPYRDTPAASQNSGWVTGLALFAGVVMLVNGILDIFQGIVAVIDNDLIVTTPNYVFRFDVTSWGWVHIVIGALVVVAGAGVLRGALWGRIAGIVLASVSAISAFMWLPYYPVWNIIVIALDVFVIWALCLYHDEDRAF